MLAAHAIVDNSMLVNPYPAVSSRHQVFMAVPANPFLQLRRQPYFVLHCNPSCRLDMLVRNPAVFLKALFGKIKQ